MWNTNTLPLPLKSNLEPAQRRTEGGCQWNILIFIKFNIHTRPTSITTGPVTTGNITEYSDVDKTSTWILWGFLLLTERRQREIFFYHFEKVHVSSTMTRQKHLTGPGSISSAFAHSSRVFYSLCHLVCAAKAFKKHVIINKDGSACPLSSLCPRQSPTGPKAPVLRRTQSGSVGGCQDRRSLCKSRCLQGGGDVIRKSEWRTGKAVDRDQGTWGITENF